MAPELLPYQHALVESICAQINLQDREIVAKTQKGKGEQLSTDERFYVNILRMELERVKYLVKAYLRARILKVEKHLLFIVEKDQANLLS
jgi:GINS complex subunit 4